MQSQLCIILLAIGLSQILALPSTSQPLPSSASTKECFAYYLPLLDNIRETYLADSQACNDQATLEKQIVHDKVKDELNAAVSSIDVFKKCKGLQDTTKNWLDCIIQTAVGSINTTILSIAAKATKLAITVIKEYRLIDSNLDLCTNNADNAYLGNFSQLFDNLQTCCENVVEDSELNVQNALQ